jgi:nucleoside-diphosphate-sugar epimerase
MPTSACITRHFKRPSLLIVGCGDIGLRVARLLASRWRLHALTSNPARMPMLRAAGLHPWLGNLDDAGSLGALGATFEHVLHLAPPARSGRTDQRTQHLLQLLSRHAAHPHSQLKRVVYGSTTGVYGDAAGDKLTETYRTRPSTDRAHRRVDAEQQLRAFGLRTGVRVTILRIPGIYAPDRLGGHPRERLARGTPVLQFDDDVYTNHIHADDLARACISALHRGGAQRVINVCDDTCLKMGDYFDLAADLCALPRPPRISREQALVQLPALQRSFMSESRRLSNQRLKTELRLKLRYPTVASGL